MPKYTLILLTVIALGLTACQGQSQTSPTAALSTSTMQPTATQAAEAPTSTETVDQSLAGAPPGCTVISPPNTPGPTEQSVFPPVSEKDWSFGPEDAEITLIEYSDFQ
jgi:hypothetical protein